MSETILSAVKPTGGLTLGNHLGAIRHFVAAQSDEASKTTTIFPIVDLHALTVPHDPTALRRRTREAATLYLAAGIDPERSLLFRQSAVPAHTELHYLLECTAAVGELSRMIQYKEKGRGRPSTRCSLYTYPVLMAADILLFRTTRVPVGSDQAQHLELARTLAERFNRRYGEVFTVPATVSPPLAARVMDLQNPRRKMSKDDSDDALGVIRLLDPPEVVRQKVMRAVTDSNADVVYAPDSRPGVANLLQILAACTGRTEAADLTGLAAGYRSYGDLKSDVADAVEATLAPIRKRYADLAVDPDQVDALLRAGADRAAKLAAPTLAAARRAIGLCQ